MRELVLGCGNYPYKKIYAESKEYVNPTRVDIDPDCKPDITLDLNTNSLPFPDSSFESIKQILNEFICKKIMAYSSLFYRI